MYDASEENKLEGDPGVRVRKMLTHDMLRNEIYARVQALITEFVKAHNCQPTWARVGFGLNYRNNCPCLKEPCTICGLVFREALDLTDNIEVGNSVFEVKP